MDISFNQRPNDKFFTMKGMKVLKKNLSILCLINRFFLICGQLKFYITKGYIKTEKFIAKKSVKRHEDQSI